MPTPLSPLLKALRLVHVYTSKSMDLGRLCGNGNVFARMRIIQALDGLDKMPSRHKCGINVVKTRLYNVAGTALEGFTSERDREHRFAQWAMKELETVYYGQPEIPPSTQLVNGAFRYMVQQKIEAESKGAKP